ncbi:hypothetical protein LOTGIDRAFT_175493 [Lottia gigantea]|uniref:Uncharacterized protein n=1 Tax=Lottia gigantea TaxID=225164 RepID=V4BYB1_LOTGI|nr:hypothetical protein LOTGIDRAFT_175493 [Lottia gigantea]ESO94114.1 hypothetical protein LOTGIDRAFT_175493 [Lottia gigantea]
MRRRLFEINGKKVGYYQNERDVFNEEDEEGLEEDEVIKPLTNGVENPEYFDTPRQNGLSGSVYKPNPKPRKIDYYNDLNQVSPVEKKQLILRVNSNEGGHETSI